MPDYSTALLRSLIDRASALGSYVRTLQSKNSRSDRGFSIALEMYYRYTQLLIRQVETDWAETTDVKIRHARLLGWIEEFFHKESWFDGRFARGSQGEVPRALKTIARRELKSHGLDDYEPVLTVGPPDSFETHKSDLANFLFGNLPVVREQRDLVDLPIDTRLAIISVPYIEGTRALWLPIAIGHEIGHLRLEIDRATMKHMNVRQWVDETDADLAAMLEMEKYQKIVDVGVAEDCRRKLQSWVDEILCDLNAVRLYGPAGLSAIAEFLAVVAHGRRLQPGADQQARTEHGAESATSTHPPLSLRIRTMRSFLDDIGEGVMPTFVDPWLEYVSANHRPFSEKPSYLIHLVEQHQHLHDINIHAVSWGELYRHGKRQAETDWTCSELLDGIPGGTHCLTGSSRGSLVRTADVVTAAWSAREELERPQDQHNDVPRGMLVLDAHTAHDKRIQIDNLAPRRSTPWSWRPYGH